MDFNVGNEIINSIFFSLYGEFKGCLDEVKIRNEVKCPNDYKWKSLKAHDTDVRALTGGMNPAECRGT